MFKNIKIVTVLYAVLALSSIMQLTTNGLFYNSLKENQRNSHTEQVIRNQQTKLYKLGATLIKTRNTLSRYALYSTLAEKNKKYIGTAETMFTLSAKLLAEADAGFNEFSKSLQPSSEQDNEELIAAYREYYQALSDLKEMLSKDNMAGYLAQPTQQYQDRFILAYEGWLATKQAQMDETADNNEREHNFSIGIAIFMSLLSLITTGLMWLMLQRILLKPLAALIEHIRHITRGDLTDTIHVEGQNEIAQLASSLNEMQQSLTRTVSDVRGGAKSIFTSATTISHDSGDLASRTEQQAASLEETAASMEELTATVKQNADNARQASQLALSASETALRGGKVVDNVVTTMGEISHSSKKIADIISVIDSIAFQTNILALNAAVEAARAGEQGRGFAVVAGEVRSLASRSAQAAKEIKDLIVESVSCVDTGSVLVSSAGETMNDIVDAVKRVTDIMAEIAAASDEQSRGIEQVSQAVTEMDSVTQQNAALVEASASAAATLEEQASRLGKAVAVFTLPGSVNSLNEITEMPLLSPKSNAKLENKAQPAEDNWVTF
ncbi:methyl-accepting chemotaxis protein [Mixta hanseatica]|uniref:Tar ligand binding domain-containing protein n=1 Tax=Mixta hanseatica TaxID=2872648 RepID=A0ABY4R412_9GAMM|nr:methyl-accepting chemotaxis protein [Mixta hanseatica]UQY42699.1 Tar ligand binding domain-containing protein [Mixta hanseatica]